MLISYNSYPLKIGRFDRLGTLGHLVLCNIDVGFVLDEILRIKSHGMVEQITNVEFCVYNGI
jgi:hypothetical protein